MLAGGAMALSAGAAERDLFVQTDAYRWVGDTIYQNEFKAWADNI